MRHRARARVLRVALALPIAILLGAPASAGGRSEERERKVLLHDDESVLARQSPLEHFEIAESHGIAYRRELRFGRHPVMLKVHGPVQRKGIGIGFKIKF